MAAILGDEENKERVESYQVLDSKFNLEILETDAPPTLDLSTELMQEPIFSPTLSMHADIVPSIITNTMIIKKLSKTAAPLLGVGIVRSGEIIIMTLLISKIGTKALAADALVATLSDFLVQTNLALLAPIAPMVGTSFSTNKLEVGRIVKQGWILATALSIPVMTGQWFAEPILNLFGQSAELTSIVGQFSRVACFAAPPIFLLAVDYNFLKSIRKENVLFPTYIFTAAIGTGVFYILSTGQLGLPASGYAGLGYALLSQAWLSWAALKIYFCTKDFKPFGLFEFRIQNLNQLKRILKIGAPLYFLSFVEQGTILAIGTMTGWLGTNQLAINQALYTYLQFPKAIIDGIRQSSQICVSNYRSIGDYRNMRRFGNIGILLEGSINLLPLIIMSSFSTEMARPFISSDDFESLETFIRIAFITKALTKLFEAIQGATTENLKGLFDTAYPSIVQFVTNIAVILPLSYVMGFILGWDLLGINTAAIVGFSVSTPLLLRRWFSISHSVEASDDVSILEESIDERALIASSNLSVSGNTYHALPELKTDIETQIIELGLSSLPIARRKSEPSMLPLYANLKSHGQGKEFGEVSAPLIASKLRSESSMLPLYANLRSHGQVEEFGEVSTPLTAPKPRRKSEPSILPLYTSLTGSRRIIKDGALISSETASRLVV